MAFKFSLRRLALMLLTISILLILAITSLGWSAMHLSLAQLDGSVPAPSLRSDVSVQRDALGIPTIRAQNLEDASYALGFLHAQERFFQMDLLRRTGAGELAALFGAAAIDTDEHNRLHQFRLHARQALPTLPAQDRAILSRYAAGVNAGLAALPSRPFEYWLLRTKPEPWRAEDSLLVIYAMYLDLQGHGAVRLYSRGWLARHSAPQQLDFLLPSSSQWDVPLDGPLARTKIEVPPQAPAIWGKPLQMAQYQPREDAMTGSNGWLVAGSRTADGHAWLANDMHLGLMLPNIWFRAELRYRNTAGEPVQLAGLTLPGSPGLVSGSNGHIAWGFTNSYADTTDLIRLEPDPADPQQYLTHTGKEKLTKQEETIQVSHAQPVRLTVELSRWGPVTHTQDGAWAIHWVAHEAGAVDMTLLHMADARSVAEALAIGCRAGIPAQNLMVADSAGHIGWGIAGVLPQHKAFDGHGLPRLSTEADLDWSGLQAPAQHPRLLDPADGILWTANNRQLASKDYEKIGDGGADLGARAWQIHADLQSLQRVDANAMRAIQLDDRARMMQEWRQRLLSALTDSAVSQHPLRAEARSLLQRWDGTASASAVGYRIVRDWRDALYKGLFGHVDEMLNRQWPGADYRRADPRWNSVLATLLEQKPSGWLPAHQPSWDAFELQQLDQVLTELTTDGQELAQATWGEQNRADIVHPFVRFLPWLRPLLAAPRDALSGDLAVPHVVNARFGASERLVVSPGHEQDATLVMPGGQSGNPLSPYFLAGHAAWVDGGRLPLLPGRAEHTLLLNKP